ncbi:MAG: uncharacterized protein PWQ96_626 [Clostridia bacterium]|jgi:hypothetical protein|nr:hypothetical protein [Clostridiales bacterium]MDK2984984.1 uncharacterized protein [Clostridia bacterium]
MSLKEKLQQDMKDAMKEREAGKLKLSVLRLTLAAIKNKEIQSGYDLDDAAIEEVIAKEVKQRREAMAEYQNVGREDVVRKLNQEIEFLLPYLPQQLTEGEIRQIVEKAIAQVGAKDKSDLGKVMGAVMPQVKGKADGKIVNKIAQELLG